MITLSLVLIKLAVCVAASAVLGVAAVAILVFFSFLLEDRP